MADTRTLTVRVTGETSSLGRSFSKASRESQTFGSKVQGHVGNALRAVGRWSMYAGAALAAGVGVGLVESVKKAADLQVATVKLRKAVLNSGLSWTKYGDQLQNAADKTSLMTGFTGVDLQTSMATLLTTTGKVTTATKLQAEAMDLARAKGIPLANASVILSKVWNGNTTSLTRLGIHMPKITAAMDALTAKTGTATLAQKAAAKAADLVSNRQAALAALQKKFGGSAAAYGRTAAGEMDRVRAAADILMEHVGKMLLPVIQQMLQWVTAHMPQIQKAVQTTMRDIRAIWLSVGKPAFEAVKRLIAQIAAAAQQDWPKVTSAARHASMWMEANLVPAFQNIRKAFDHQFGSMPGFLHAVFGGMVTVIKPILATLRDIIAVALDIIGGRWRQAWSNLKSAVVNALNGIRAVIANRIGAALGPAVSAFNLVSSAIQALIGWIGRIHWPSPPSWITHLPGYRYIPGTATGGIVTRPQVRLVGEAGPEAIVPLNHLHGRGGLGGITIIVQGSLIHQNDLADLVRKAISQGVRTGNTFRPGGLQLR